MCPTHWHQVPKGLQDAIYRNWRAKNSQLHMAACKAAIKFVSEAVNAVSSPQP